MILIVSIKQLKPHWGIVTTTTLDASGGKQSVFGTQEYFGVALATVLSAKADCLPLEDPVGVIGSLLRGSFRLLILMRNLKRLQYQVCM